MVLGGWYFAYRAQGEDRELPVYVTGGERMAAGQEIYRAGADKKPFTYPPFAAVPFVPFALLPESWQPPAWFCVNFLIVLGVCRWLHRWGRREWPGAGPPRLGWYWVLLLLLGVHHVLSVFTNQSHDLLIAGAVALVAAAWCRERSSAAIWAGVGGAVKATPLLFLGLFVLRLRPLAVGLLLGTFAALSLLPDWWFPRADGRWWLQAWYEVNLRGLDVGGPARAAGAWNAHSFLNQSLSGTLTRLLTPVTEPGKFVDEHVVLAALSPAACKNVLLAAQLAVLGVIALGVRGAGNAIRGAGDPRAMQNTLGLGEVAAFACGMVLLSPQSSKSHFCVWLFPAAYLADRVLRGRRDAWLWILLVLAILLGPLTGKTIVGTEFGNRLNAFGNVTWCTVVLLLATVRSLCTAGAPREGVAP